jgi:uncharacterized cysteine cluster protein YcgN (CxxCxxCC family)
MPPPWPTLATWVKWMNARPFWEMPLHRLSKAEWEALCDGCGQCCLHKVEDEDSGAIYPTNVACKLLDLRSGQCADYKNRRARCPIASA